MRNANIKWFDLQEHRVRLSAIIDVQRVERIQTQGEPRYGFTVVTLATGWSVNPRYRNEAEAVAVRNELLEALDCQAASGV